MNVLMLMLSPPSAHGGMEKHFSELANGLAKTGTSVWCMSAPEHLESLDSTIPQIPIRTDVSRYSPKLLRTIVNAQRDHKFDIIHAQGSKAAATIQLLSRFLSRTKLIATIHNFKSHYPGSHRFSRIIAVSNALANDINSSRVTVVYNGISDNLRAAEPKSNELHDKPVWLAVGRLVHAKGFDLLISAFKTAKGSLIIAGDGPERDKLQAQIDKLALTERVTLLGYQTNIPELMKSVDAIAISSRKEGFSYVCAEALLAGKPIVSTDVPVANELLPPEHICPTEDVTALSRLLNIPISELESAQTSIRAFATSELTLNAMIENTLNIYREVVHHED